MKDQTPRLWIIDPSVAVAEDEGVAELLEGWPGEARLFRPCLEPGSGPGPATGYEVEGVILMGSRASVHDGAAWLSELGAWLRPIVAGGVRRPVLGICFGHQLLAHLAGAPVRYVSSDRTKLVGVATSRLVGGRLLPGSRELRVVVSHREQVGEPCSGWHVSASRDETPVDGLEHDRLPLFGFQFHPEAREAFATRNGIDPVEIDDRLRRDNRELLGAFKDLVIRERAASSSRA